MKLRILGTGHAMTEARYNTCFVIDDDGKYLLVDGGGGNQLLSRLKEGGIGLTDIHQVFVTHKHLDHLMGILWLLRVDCQMLKMGVMKEDVVIYGHDEVIGILADLTEKLLDVKLKWNEEERRYSSDFQRRKANLYLTVVGDGEVRIINGRKVTFFDIQSTKAKQFGFTMEVEKDTTISDQRFNSDSSILVETSPKQKSKTTLETLSETTSETTSETMTDTLSESKVLSWKLTCCGDEPFAECERKYAEGSRWLLHEAFCLYSEAGKYRPYEKHHSTVKDACELAESLGVENLVLYHTEEEHLAERKKLYSQEGKLYYHGNLFVPEDGEVIELDGVHSSFNDGSCRKTTK